MRYVGAEQHLSNFARKVVLSNGIGYAEHESAIGFFLTCSRVELSSFFHVRECPVSGLITGLFGPIFRFGFQF